MYQSKKKIVLDESLFSSVTEHTEKGMSVLAEDRYARELAKRMKALTSDNKDSGAKQRTKRDAKQIAMWRVVQNWGTRSTVEDGFTSEQEAAQYVRDHGGVGKLSVVKYKIDEGCLREDITDTKSIDNPTDVGVSTIINNLIKDEYATVDAYNSAILTLQSSDCSHEVLGILNDIVAEENIHIGQLQQTMKLFDTNAEKIEDGIEEAEKQLSDSVVEGYGGAYDIDDDDYFTHDDLLDFGIAVSDRVSTAFDVVWDIYDIDMKSDRRTIYIELCNNITDENVWTNFNIDMRKIKLPRDLIKVYAQPVADELIKQIEEL